MLTEKKTLTLETIEAQSGLALPDRELLHASNGGTQYINETNASVECSGNSASGLLVGATIPVCVAAAVGAQIDGNTIPITVAVIL